MNHYVSYSRTEPLYLQDLVGRERIQSLEIFCGGFKCDIKRTEYYGVIFRKFAGGGGRKLTVRLHLRLH